MTTFHPDGPFRANTKVFSCKNPTLQLFVVEYLDADKKIIVETAQKQTKLVLVYESDKYVLRKFNPRGEIAGKVLNNWELADKPHICNEPGVSDV